MRPTLIMPLKFLLLALFAFQPPQTTHRKQQCSRAFSTPLFVLAFRLAATQSPFQPVEVQPKPDGWIAITVPPELFTAKLTGFALRGAKHSFHARETGQFAPYLAVQGTK
jgi:hypothetical protein